MTLAEKNKLIVLCSMDKWNALSNVLKYLGTLETVEETELRTEQQHKSLFFWFGQIEKICAEIGITIPMLMRHVIELQVKKAWLHWLWKVLQKALFGTDSTKKLEKVGQIDDMQDHFVALFAKEGVELPPFPSNETNMTSTREDPAFASYYESDPTVTGLD